MVDAKGWVDIATVVGGFATAFAAAFAIVGVPLVYVQIMANRKTQREATAKTLYRQYLEDSVNRPELAQPNLEKLREEGRFVQYELYVAHMLYSLEEVLLNVSDDGWFDVARGQLRRHLEYLSSDAFRSKRSYYDKVLMSMLDELKSIAHQGEAN